MLLQGEGSEKHEAGLSTEGNSVLPQMVVKTKHHVVTETVSHARTHASQKWLEETELALI